jgi:hypothetical protein
MKCVTFPWLARNAVNLPPPPTDDKGGAVNASSVKPVSKSVASKAQKAAGGSEEKGKEEKVKETVKERDLPTIGTCGDWNGGETISV